MKKHDRIYEVDSQLPERPSIMKFLINGHYLDILTWVITLINNY